jgi:hypothetical protein
MKNLLTSKYTFLFYFNGIITCSSCKIRHQLLLELQKRSFKRKPIVRTVPNTPTKFPIKKKRVQRRFRAKQRTNTSLEATIV